MCKKNDKYEVCLRTIRHGNERLSNSLKIAWTGRSLCNDHSGVPIFPHTEASIFFDVSHQSSQSSLSLPQSLPTTPFTSNVYKVSSFSCRSLIVAWPGFFLSCTCYSSWAGCTLSKRPEEWFDGEPVRYRKIVLPIVVYYWKPFQWVSLHCPFHGPKILPTPRSNIHIFQNLPQKRVSLALKSNQRILRARNVSFDQHILQISGYFSSKPIAHCVGPF